MSMRLRLVLLASSSAMLLFGVMFWHAVSQPKDATTLALRQFDPGAQPASDLRAFTAASGTISTLGGVGEAALILVFLGGPLRRWAAGRRSERIDRPTRA